MIVDKNKLNIIDTEKQVALFEEPQALETQGTCNLLMERILVIDFYIC